MARSVHAPKGLYTAEQAIAKLRMPKATFHDYVKKGKIRKVVPPGKSQGYYEKVFIDDMAEANELFAIQYATDPATFEVATINDIEGIYHVMISFWGSLYVPSVKLRQSWYEVNPEIDYVVKQNGIVTGYLTILPLKQEIIKQLMDGEIGTKDIKPDDILPFISGIPLECWVGIAVKTGVYKPEKYGIRLIAGARNVLNGMGKRKVHIKRLWAKSETADGIKLCGDLGFESIDASSTKLPKKFVLDMDTTQSPHLQQYKRTLNKNT
ncbi:MAG: hypothetical protein ACRDHZ_08855 [Ktedonobacteraceae bacterium]